MTPVVVGMLSQWPDYKLPSQDSAKLALQCLKSISGTCDAGRCWYALISGHFRELGMNHSSIDHGIFLWKWNNETCFLALETDDILMVSPSRAPFLYLKSDLEKLFDLTCTEGAILRFLNLCLILSPCGISMDQMSHIKINILHEYFKDILPSSIPKTFYPFPLASSFEQLFYEAPPLTSRDLQLKEKNFRFSFNHIVGELMHIANMSNPD